MRHHRILAVLASTVDQEIRTTTGTGSVTSECAGVGFDLVAQTFTAGRTGTLDKVSLVLRLPSGNPVLRLETRTVDGLGVPTSTVIGSGTYAGPFNGDGAFTDVPLASPAAVVAGTQYALVWSALGDCTWWAG